MRLGFNYFCDLNVCNKKLCKWIKKIIVYPLESPAISLVKKKKDETKLNGIVKQL